MQHLVELAGGLEQRTIYLRSITDSIGTTTAAGRFFFHVMAALANMERDLIVERRPALKLRGEKAGLAAAGAR